MEELDLAALELELGTYMELELGIELELNTELELGSELELEGSGSSLEDDISSLEDDGAAADELLTFSEDELGTLCNPVRSSSSISLSVLKTSNRLSLPSLHPVASTARTTAAAIKERDNLSLRFCSAQLE